MSDILAQSLYDLRSRTKLAIEKAKKRDTGGEPSDIPRLVDYQIEIGREFLDVWHAQLNTAIAYRLLAETCAKHVLRDAGQHRDPIAAVEAMSSSEMYKLASQHKLMPMAAERVSDWDAELLNLTRLTYGDDELTAKHCIDNHLKRTEFLAECHLRVLDGFEPVCWSVEKTIIWIEVGIKE